MKIWELLKKIGITIVGIFVSSLILASIVRLSLGWDLRAAWGIWLLVCTAGAALILEYGNHISKIPARVIAGIFLSLALIIVWPGFEYLIAKNIGKTTAKSYVEFQAYKDLRSSEVIRPEDLQGREILYHQRLKREKEISNQLQQDLNFVDRLRAPCLSTEQYIKQTCLYSDKELSGMEKEAREKYERNTAELNKTMKIQGPSIRVGSFGFMGFNPYLAVFGIIAAIAAISFFIWRKEKGGTLSSGTPSSDGKKRMRPGLIILAFVGYIIYFWVQYAFLRYWIVEWTGMSPFSVTLLLTVQQIIIIGILYYLIEPLVPEPGKVRYAFILISIFGALNLYIGYVAYPYEFFDFKTGESRFWVSDDEDEIYYASGYSKLYGTPLRQGTKEDAIKYKSQIDSSVLASPFKQLKSLKIPKIFGEKPPALEPYAGKFDSLKTNIVLEESLSPRAPFDRRFDLPKMIKKGDIIAVEVSGNYIWDPAADGYIGPCGASWTPKQLHYKAKFPILEYGIAGVVLKIGDGGYVGLCESGQRTFNDRGKVLATFRALEDSGSLTVAINERWDSSAYSDNSGNISVRAWLIN